VKRPEKLPVAFWIMEGAKLFLIWIAALAVLYLPG
jgi:hypothetical protein